VFAPNILDPVTKECLLKKFEMVFFSCKEKLPFTKFFPLCEMEAQHGVKSGYKNDHTCVPLLFVLLTRTLKGQLGKINFFSIQADASTDAANKECELFMIKYLDTTTADETLHVRDRFLAVRYLDSGTGEGLCKCFDKMISYVCMNDLVEQ